MDETSALPVLVEADHHMMLLQLPDSDLDWQMRYSAICKALVLIAKRRRSINAESDK